MRGCRAIWRCRGGAVRAAYLSPPALLPPLHTAQEDKSSKDDRIKNRGGEQGGNRGEGGMVGGVRGECAGARLL